MNLTPISEKLLRLGSRVKHCSPFSSKSTDVQINEIFQQSITSEQDLSQASLDFERQFLHVLESLEEFQRISESLTTSSDTMLSLDEGDENPIQSVSQVLDTHLNFVRDSAELFKTLIRGLEIDKEKIDQTLSHEKKLNQTISQLTFIRTLFCVESAPLDQEVKMMFTSLVDEILRLQTDVSGIFTEKFESLRQYRNTITNLIAHLEGQASSLFEIFETKRSEMEKALETQKERLSQNLSLNSTLKTNSLEISSATGQAIISLQTQDIISQKIQHVFEISDEMRTRFTAAKLNGDKDQKCSEFRFVEHAPSVVINQIHSIKSELKEANQQIHSSFNRISSAIAAIDLSCDLSSTPEANHKNQRPQDLTIALEETGRMIALVELSSKEAFAAIQPVRSMASNVTDIILNLSAQLHLIGLNAEVHAAQTGGSSGLEILSSKTSEISIETKELCKGVSTSLDDLVENLNESVNKFESLNADAKNFNASIFSAIPTQSERLSAYQSQRIQASSNAAESLESLKKLVAEKSQEIDLEKAMTDELSRIQTLQQSIAEQSKKMADKLKVKGNIDVPEIMQGLLSRYTMDSEKSVHLMSLGGVSESESIPSPTSRSEDGIEFFSRDDNSLEWNDDSESKIDIFDDFETVAQKEDTKSEYGDNVELF